MHFTTAALSDIKSFLAANAAEAGLASAMKFKGWKVADVRAYAEQVQWLRVAGYVGDITPGTVAAATQQVADERAAADAANAMAEATAAELMALVNAQVAAASTAATDKRARWQREPNTATVAKLQALIDAAGGGDEVRLTAELLAAHNIAATWLGNTAAFTQEGGVRFVAAMRCGYTVTEFKRAEHVTLRRAA